MKNIDNILLKEILSDDVKKADAYNIRKDGISIDKKQNPNIEIIPRDDGKGLKIYVKENTKFNTIHIPVLLTESGLEDVVYNDFYIGKNSNVLIMAGCAIHNDKHKNSKHDGVHSFYLEENSKVKYFETHYGEGKGKGDKILNPITHINLKKNSEMIIESTQIKGVDDTNRITKATLEENATLIVNEKILTNNIQKAITDFEVNLNGKDSSCHITSRSVAENKSYQEFNSKINGDNKCYAHVECDAIIKDKAIVKAIPSICAKNVDANLVHEAFIGKIAGQQLLKLMSLGLSETEAEETIIKGFLK